MTQRLPTTQNLQSIQPIKSIYSRYPVQTIRPRVAAQPYAQAYSSSSPFALDSFSDALFNKRARERAYFESTGSLLGSDPLSQTLGSVIAGYTHLVKNYLNPIMDGDMNGLVSNTWNSLSQDLDVLSNPIKGMVIEGGDSTTNLVYGALAALAAGAATAFSGGTVGVILSAGVLAGGAASVGGAVLQDPESALRGFQKGLGNTDYGRVVYKYNTGNFVLDFFGEVVTDPLNWVSASAGALRGAAVSSAATGEVSSGIVGAVVDSSTNSFGLLKALSNVDRWVTSAVLMSNPIGASLGLISLANKTWGSAVLNSMVESIVKYAEKPTDLELAGVADVIEVARGAVTDMVSKVRNKNLYELGILGKTSNSDFLDAVNDMSSALRVLSGDHPDINSKLIERIVKDIAFKTPGEFLEGLSEYSDPEVVKKLVDIFFNRTMKVLKDGQMTEVFLRPELSKLGMGFASGYAKSGFKQGIAAVNGFFDEILAHVGAFDAAREALRHDFEGIDNLIRGLVDVDNTAVSKGTYFDAVYQSLLKRSPDFEFVDLEKNADKFLYREIQKRYLEPVGISMEEFIAWHKAYQLGEESLIVNKDGALEMVFGLLTDNSEKVAVNFDDIPVSFDKAIEDIPDEVMTPAQLNTIDAIEHPVAPTWSTAGHTFNSVTQDAATESDFQVVRKYSFLKTSAIKMLNSKLVAAYQIPGLSDRGGKQHKMMMDLGAFYPHIMKEYLNKTLADATPEFKAFIANIFYDYANVMRAIKDPGAVKGGAEHTRFTTKIEPEYFTSTEVEVVKPGLLNKKFNKNDGLSPLDRFLMSYLRLERITYDKIEKMFIAEGLADHALLDMLSDFELVNQSLMISQDADLTMYEEGWIPYTPNLIFEARTMLSAIIKDEELVELMSTIMSTDKNSLGVLINLIATSTVNDDLDVGIYKDAREVVVAIRSTMNYLNMIKKIDTLGNVFNEVEPNHKLVMEMQQPAKVTPTAEGIVVKPFEHKGKTWDVGKMYKHTIYKALMKSNKELFRVVDLSKLKVLNPDDVERVVNMANGLETMESDISIEVRTKQEESFNAIKMLSRDLADLDSSLMEVHSRLKEFSGDSADYIKITNALDNIAKGREALEETIHSQEVEIGGKLDNLVLRVKGMEDEYKNILEWANEEFIKEMHKMVEDTLNEDKFARLKTVKEQLAVVFGHKGIKESLKEVGEYTQLSDLRKVISEAVKHLDQEGVFSDDVKDALDGLFTNSIVPFSLSEDFTDKFSSNYYRYDGAVVAEYNKLTQIGMSQQEIFDKLSKKYSLKKTQRPNIEFRKDNQPIALEYGPGLTWGSTRALEAFMYFEHGLYRQMLEVVKVVAGVKTKSFVGDLDVIRQGRTYLTRRAQLMHKGMGDYEATITAIVERTQDLFTNGVGKETSDSLFYKYLPAASLVFIQMYAKLKRMDASSAEHFKKALRGLYLAVDSNLAGDSTPTIIEEYEMAQKVLNKFIIEGDDEIKKDPYLSTVFATHIDGYDRVVTKASKNLVFKGLLRGDEFHKIYKYSEEDLKKLFNNDYAYDFYIKPIREITAMLCGGVYPKGVEELTNTPLSNEFVWDASEITAFLRKNTQFDIDDINDVLYKMIDPSKDTLRIENHMVGEGEGFEKTEIMKATGRLLTKVGDFFALVPKRIAVLGEQGRYVNQEEFANLIDRDKASREGMTRGKDGEYSTSTLGDRRVQAKGHRKDLDKDIIHTKALNVLPKESVYNRIPRGKDVKTGAPAIKSIPYSFTKGEPSGVSSAAYEVMEVVSQIKSVFKNSRDLDNLGLSKDALFHRSPAQAIRSLDAELNRPTPKNLTSFPFGAPADVDFKSNVEPIVGYPVNIVSDSALSYIAPSKFMEGLKEAEVNTLASSVIKDIRAIRDEQKKILKEFKEKNWVQLHKIMPSPSQAHPKQVTMATGETGTIISPMSSTALLDEFDTLQDNYEQLEKFLEFLVKNEKDHLFFESTRGTTAASGSLGNSSRRGLKTAGEQLQKKVKEEELIVGDSQVLYLAEGVRAEKFLNDFIRLSGEVSKGRQLTIENFSKIRETLQKNFPSVKVPTDVVSFNEFCIEYRASANAVKMIAEDIIRLNLPMIQRVAGKFSGRGVDFDLLESTASLALAKAVETYNPSLSSFATHARITIEGAIRGEIRDTGRSMGFTKKDIEKMAKYGKEVKDLEEKYELKPTATYKEVMDCVKKQMGILRGPNSHFTIYRMTHTTANDNVLYVRHDKPITEVRILPKLKGVVPELNTLFKVPTTYGGVPSRGRYAMLKSVGEFPYSDSRRKTMYMGEITYYTREWSPDTQDFKIVPKTDTRVLNTPELVSLTSSRPYVETMLALQKNIDGLTAIPSAEDIVKQLHEDSKGLMELRRTFIKDFKVDFKSGSHIERFVDIRGGQSVVSGSLLGMVVKADDGTTPTGSLLDTVVKADEVKPEHPAVKSLMDVVIKAEDKVVPIQEVKAGLSDHFVAPRVFNHHDTKSHSFQSQPGYVYIGRDTKFGKNSGLGNPFEMKTHTTVYPYFKGYITKLKSNEIFVFGSNDLGHHHAGAAYQAQHSFGAIPKTPSGIQGQSYGIVTRSKNPVTWDHTTNRLEDIFEELLTFVAYADDHPEKNFLFTDIGTGLAGLTIPDIAKLFDSIALIPDNIIFSEKMYLAIHGGYPSAASLKRVELDPKAERTRVIVEYEKHLRSELAKGSGETYEAFQKLLTRYKAGEELYFGCFCAPQPCHGDILRKVLEEEAGSPTPVTSTVVDKAEGKLTEDDLKNVFVVPFSEDKQYNIYKNKNGEEKIFGMGTGFVGPTGTWYGGEQHGIVSNILISHILTKEEYRAWQDELIEEDPYGGDGAEDAVMSRSNDNSIKLTKEGYILMVDGVPVMMGKEPTLQQYTALKRNFDTLVLQKDSGAISESLKVQPFDMVVREDGRVTTEDLVFKTWGEVEDYLKKGWAAKRAKETPVAPVVTPTEPEAAPVEVKRTIPTAVLDMIVPGAIIDFSKNGKHHFLSNMYKYKVSWRGREYPSSEAAFQTAKFTNAEDQSAVALAVDQYGKYSGYASKNKAKELYNTYSKAPNPKPGEEDLSKRLTPNWELKKFGVMKEILTIKFQNKVLKEWLLGTGSAPLVETNTWDDNTWGVSNTSGQNMLGRMLMQIRGELGGTGEVTWKKDLTDEQVRPMVKKTYATANGFLPYALRPGVDSAAMVGSRDGMIGKAGKQFATEHYKQKHSELEEIMDLMNACGLIVNSGGAPGPDDVVSEKGIIGRRKIFVPWYKFTKGTTKDSGDVGLLRDTALSDEIVLDNMGNKQQAYVISRKYFRGNLDMQSKGVQAMMTRNVYQVLGEDLKTPVSFVVCWTPTGDTKGIAPGGTGQAMRIAQASNIPVFNIENESDRQTLIRYLRKMKAQQDAGVVPEVSTVSNSQLEIVDGKRYETGIEYGTRVQKELFDAANKETNELADHDVWTLEAKLKTKSPEVYAWYVKTFGDDITENMALKKAYFTHPTLPEDIDYTKVYPSVKTAREELGKTRIAKDRTSAALSALRTDKARRNKILKESEESANARLLKLVKKNEENLPYIKELMATAEQLVEKMTFIKEQLLEHETELNKLRDPYLVQNIKMAKLKTYGVDIRNPKSMEIINEYLDGDHSKSWFILNYVNSFGKDQFDTVKQEDGSLFVNPAVSDKLESGTIIKAGRIMTPVFDENDPIIAKLKARTEDLIVGSTSIPSEAVKNFGDDENMAFLFKLITVDPKYDIVVKRAITIIKAYMNEQLQLEAMGGTTVRFLNSYDKDRMFDMFTKGVPSYIDFLNDPNVQKMMYLEKISEIISRFFKPQVSEDGDYTPSVVSRLKGGQQKIDELSREYGKYVIKPKATTLIDDETGVVTQVDNFIAGIIAGSTTVGATSFLSPSSSSYGLMQGKISLGGQKLEKLNPEMFKGWSAMSDKHKLTYLRINGIDIRTPELLRSGLINYLKKEMRFENESRNLGGHRAAMDNANLELSLLHGDYTKVLYTMKSNTVFGANALRHLFGNKTEFTSDELYNEMMKNTHLLDMLSNLNISIHRNTTRSGSMAKPVGYELISKQGVSTLQQLLDFGNKKYDVVASLLKANGLGERIMIFENVLGKGFDPRSLNELKQWYGVTFERFVHPNGSVVWAFIPDNTNKLYQDVVPLTGMLKMNGSTFTTGMDKETIKAFDAVQLEMSVMSTRPSPLSWKDGPLFRWSDEYLPKFMLDAKIITTEEQFKQVSSQLQDSGNLPISILGGYEDLKTINPMLPSSPFSMIISSAMSMSEHTLSKSYFIRQFFQEENRLPARFQSDDPKVIFERYKGISKYRTKNDNGFVVVVLNSKYQLVDLVINSPKDVASAIDKGGMLISQVQFVKMFHLFNSNRLPKVIDWINRNVNSVFKAGMMLSPAFVARNMVDNPIKLLFRFEGGLETIGYIPLFMGVYIPTWRRIVEALWEFDKKNDRIGKLEYIRDLDAEDRNMYKVVASAIEAQVSFGPKDQLMDISVISEELQAKADRGVTREKASVIQEAVWNFPPLKALLDFNGLIENSARSALFLRELKEGATFSGAAKTVAEYLINYNTKNIWEEDMSVVLLFWMFKLHNMVFWADHALDNPAVLRAILDLVDQSWLETKRKQMQELTTYQQAAYNSGNIALGSTIAKLNPSFYDAVMSLTDIIKDPYSKINPVIRDVVSVMSGSTKDIQMPWDGLASKAEHVMIGVQKLMQDQEVSMPDMLPGFFGTNYIMNPPASKMRTRYGLRVSSNTYRKNFYGNIWTRSLKARSSNTSFQGVMSDLNYRMGQNKYRRR